jgi:hypothetical protein
MKEYELGFVGRSNCLIVCIDRKGQDLITSSGTLFMVMHKEIFKDATGPDDDGVRYTVRRLLGRGRPDPLHGSSDNVAFGMLDPEPAVPEWPKEDSDLALGQGWDIFNRDDNEDGEMFEIQKVDEANNFKTDQDAWAFVWERAVQWQCPLARRALVFISTRSPQEYARIKAHALAKKPVPLPYSRAARVKPPDVPVLQVGPLRNTLQGCQFFIHGT